MDWKQNLERWFYTEIHRMPARITNFIPGSCFGYNDESNKVCKKCKLFDSCRNASTSNEV